MTSSPQLSAPIATTPCSARYFAPSTPRPGWAFPNRSLSSPTRLSQPVWKSTTSPFLKETRAIGREVAIQLHTQRIVLFRNDSRGYQRPFARIGDIDTQLAEAFQNASID